jgi:pimeloyl-ACP methyl ester carboxylesterase
MYPGGRVDPRSYAPLARSISQRGFLVVIVPMPLNLAVFNPSAAAGVITKYPQVEHWAVGGHSLGGAMAAQFAAEQGVQFDGLVLWAAYPSESSDLSDSTLPVLSISGTLDGLSTIDKIEASRSLLPADTVWAAIDGGNHAQFGWYGLQAGDNPASLSQEEQQTQIVDATAGFLATLQGDSAAN